MSDQYEAQVSESEKNQNEQSSADRIEADEDTVKSVPVVVEPDDEPNVIDIDGGDFSLEDLIKRAGKFVNKKKTETPAPAPAAEADAEQIIVLKAQLEQEKNNTLRALAVLQNFRRRSDEERLRIIREGNERLIKEVLPIMDDFERGLAAARANQSYDLLIGGVESVLRKFGDVMAKQGVEPIPSVGTLFNPDLHEAVSVVEATDELPDESVVAELQKGYTLNGRVIRPSLVSVAKA